MAGWLTRYSGHALIFAGLLLCSTLLRSASGPADVAGAALPAPSGRPARDDAPLLPSARRSGTAEVSAGEGPDAVADAPGTPPGTPPVATPLAIVEPSATPAPALPPTARLVIPRMRLDTRVVDVGVLPSGEMETAAFAAGRLAFSAQAGDTGNMVLAGHDDIDGEVFRRLPELQVGDEFTAYRGDQTFTYRVELRTIVREDGATVAQRMENARWMDPTDDAVATLISCYPYRVDTHRIIVRARLVA